MNNIGDAGWYVTQFGVQKSYREMLFGPYDDDRCPRCGYMHDIDDPNTCPNYGDV